MILMRRSTQHRRWWWAVPGGSVTARPSAVVGASSTRVGEHQRWVQWHHCVKVVKERRGGEHRVGRKRQASPHPWRWRQHRRSRPPSTHQYSHPIGRRWGRRGMRHHCDRMVVMVVSSCMRRMLGKRMKRSVGLLKNRWCSCGGCVGSSRHQRRCGVVVIRRMPCGVWERQTASCGAPSYGSRRASSSSQKGRRC